MSPVRSAFFVLVAASLAACAADQDLVNLMMPDANVVSGIQVQRSLASPFGQYVLGQMQKNDQGLQSFISQTGFDPRRDLTEIVAASGGTPQASTALVAARGTFDQSKISASLGKMNPGTTQYKGVTVYTHQDPKSTKGIAFLGDTIAVMGDLSAVEGAIDRSGGCSSASPCLGAGMQSQISSLSTAEDAWFLTTSALGSMLASKIPPNANLPNGINGNLVQSIQQASGGIKFGDMVALTIQAVARSPQDATSLADVVRFLMGMVQMNQNAKNPALTALVNSLQLSTTGNTMTVSLSLPETQIEQAFVEHANPHARQGAPQHQ
jgi:hypothetical protein